MSQHMSVRIRVPIEADNPSIERIESLCVKCGLCSKVCRDPIGVLDRYDLQATGGKAVCIQCGQCANVCPTASIVEKSELEPVQKVLADPSKIVVFTASPAVRVSLGEAFGTAPGAFVQGKMVSLLRRLGADYVFDTDFGADLTVMEEAQELVDRLKNASGPLPQLTSCCPAWVKFCETFHPEMLDNLSRAKSPIAMQGATIKSYFAKVAGIDPEAIVNVAVTPCTAKKFEIRRPHMNAAGVRIGKPEMRDTDYVITARELARWAKQEQIDFPALPDSAFDSPLGTASGAGVIFGNSGGVMEAALRTTYHLLTKKSLTHDALKFESVRGYEAMREATICIGDTRLRAAVVYGTKQAHGVLEDIKAGRRHYDFVEVMTCPGGCIGGGGQPKFSYGIEDEGRCARIASLYARDEALTLRSSFENPQIIAVYKDFYGTPGSDLAKAMLHTRYIDRSQDLGGMTTVPEPAKALKTADTGIRHKFRCKVCGYIYEAVSLPPDYVCPLCRAPASEFEQIA